MRASQPRISSAGFRSDTRAWTSTRGRPLPHYPAYRQYPSHDDYSDHGRRWKERPFFMRADRGGFVETVEAPAAEAIAVEAAEIGNQEAAAVGSPTSLSSTDSRIGSESKSAGSCRARSSPSRTPSGSRQPRFPSPRPHRHSSGRRGPTFQTGCVSEASAPMLRGVENAAHLLQELRAGGRL